jgi:hypothetical protein
MLVLFWQDFMYLFTEIRLLLRLSSADGHANVVCFMAHPIAI